MELNEQAVAAAFWRSKGLLAMVRERIEILNEDAGFVFNAIHNL